jgi:hypothetical protein
MQTFNFSDISLTDLKSIVELKPMGIADYHWTQPQNVIITEEEQVLLRYITTQLKFYPTHVMNEATLWARIIYPLLRLAEQDDILATSEVSLKVQYPKFELNGIVDGILGKCIAGHLEIPYLVVLEAKRALETDVTQGVS